MGVPLLPWPSNGWACGVTRQYFPALAISAQKQPFFAAAWVLSVWAAVHIAGLRRWVELVQVVRISSRPLNRLISRWVGRFHFHDSLPISE